MHVHFCYKIVVHKVMEMIWSSYKCKALGLLCHKRIDIENRKFEVVIVVHHAPSVNFGKFSTREYDVKLVVAFLYFYDTPRTHNIYMKEQNCVNYNVSQFYPIKHLIRVEKRIVLWEKERGWKGCASCAKIIKYERGITWLMMVTKVMK